MYGKELFSVYPDGPVETRSAADGKIGFSGGFPYTCFWAHLAVQSACVSSPRSVVREVLTEGPPGLVQAHLHFPSIEGLREAFSRPLSVLREFSEMCVAGS